jgi:hypothetical protein
MKLVGKHFDVAFGIKAEVVEGGLESIVAGVQEEAGFN